MIPRAAAASAASSASAASAAWERRFSPPPELNCPITRALMSAPVLAGDGYTYERAAIAYWLSLGGGARSPVTNAPLPISALVPNLTVLTMTNTYKQRVGQELCRLARVLGAGGIVAHRGRAGNDGRSGGGGRGGGRG
jgi:hypothetical protein